MILLPLLTALNLFYPIAELGNCASKQACKAYCAIPVNYQTCINFAQNRGIYKTPSRPTPTEVEKPKEERLGSIKFPIAELGSCSSAKDCKNYCDQPVNRQACFDFGRKQGLTGDQEAGSKLGGVQFPIAELGGCENFTVCEAYCDVPSHRQVCFDFAKAHGFEPPPDKRGPGGCKSPQECEKFCRANPGNSECMKGRDEYCRAEPDKCEKGPGGCTSDEECKKYCRENPNNQDCIKGRERYCQEHPDECKEQTGPGGCGSEEECKKYCEDPAHKVECQKGFDEYCQKNPNDEKCKNRINEESKKGPGGCSSPEECRRFCSDPFHQAECQKAADEFCQSNPAHESCQNREQPAVAPSGRL